MTRSFSYPTPVVGWGTDVDATVGEYSLSHALHNDELILEITELSVSDPVLQGLLMSGSARWLVRLHCATTYFQRSWTTAESSLRITLPVSSVSQKVEVSVRLVATSPLAGYRPTGIHADFGPAKFTVGVGDILAVAPDMKLFIDQAYDPLKGEVSSIIRIALGTQETGPADVDFALPRILVRIPKLDWENYKLLKNNAAQILHSAIVLPVLMQAIHFVRTKHEMSQDLAWFGRLELWLEKMGNQDSLPLLDAAQSLLANPLSRTFEEGKRFAGEDGE
jgi:hypothetical protein